MTAPKPAPRKYSPLKVKQSASPNFSESLKTETCRLKMKQSTQLHYNHNHCNQSYLLRVTLQPLFLQSFTLQSFTLQSLTLQSLTLQSLSLQSLTLQSLTLQSLSLQSLTLQSFTLQLLSPAEGLTSFTLSHYVPHYNQSIPPAVP